MLVSEDEKRLKKHIFEPVQHQKAIGGNCITKTQSPDAPQLV
jgi:hypothetical protein